MLCSLSSAPDRWNQWCLPVLSVKSQSASYGSICNLVSISVVQKQQLQSTGRWYHGDCCLFLHGGYEQHLTRKSELPDCCMESRVAWAMRFCWCCCCWNCCCCRMAAAWSRVASSNILFAMRGFAVSTGFTRLVKPTGVFSKTLHNRIADDSVHQLLGCIAPHVRQA